MREESRGIFHFQSKIDPYLKVFVSFSFKNILLLKCNILKFFVFLQFDIVIFLYQADDFLINKKLKILCFDQVFMTN